MRYRNACLRLFVVYYKIFFYRDFITTLIIGVLKYTIIQNFTFIRAFISQIQDCVASTIIHGLRLFLFILQEVHCF